MCVRYSDDKGESANKLYSTRQKTDLGLCHFELSELVTQLYKSITMGGYFLLKITTEHRLITADNIGWSKSTIRMLIE